MLLKNVLKGLKKEYNIEQLTIIKGYQVQFSGELKMFEEAKHNDMSEVVNTLLNSEVISKDNISHTKHFIFIKEEI